MIARAAVILASITVLWISLPRPDTVEIFRQSSPILEGQDKPKNSAIELLPETTILQRLWIPTSDVVAIRFFVKSKADTLLTAKLRSDEAGLPGAAGVSEPVLSFDAGAITQVTARLQKPLPSKHSWIWLEISNKADKESVSVLREIDGSKYPGGVLNKLETDNLEKVPGVISFALDQRIVSWPRPEIFIPVVILIIAIIIMVRSVEPLPRA